MVPARERGGPLARFAIFRPLIYARSLFRLAGIISSVLAVRSFTRSRLIAGAIRSLGRSLSAGIRLFARSFARSLSRGVRFRPLAPSFA